MSDDSKYGRITLEREPGNPLTPDEPVILFRARDRTTPALLRMYETLCLAANSPADHVAAIVAVRQRFEAWQRQHPDLIKAPD